MTTIPKSIKSGDTHEGWHADGNRRGRIVDIERYGFFDNFCVFELNVGGLASNSQGGSAEALVSFTVLDEEVCKFIEDAIALGKDVEVDYTQDIVEIWNPSDYFCKGVKFLDHTAPGSGANCLSKIDQANLDDIKRQLLNDRAFLEELKEKLAELPKPSKK